MLPPRSLLLALLVALAAAACGGDGRPQAAVSAPSPAPTAAAPAAATPTPTPVPTPVSRTGAFDARGGEDTVSGTATLTRGPDGKLSLQLGNLNATPGPALYVYLSHVPSPATDGQVRDGLEVAPLKAPRGDQAYAVDSTADPAEFRSVVVYCRQYRVVFGYANLSVGGT
jgi:Electron transfer DM13